MAIELIARAAILRGSRILLAHTKGAANTFLPGGHIEPGEPAREALRRELKEELGFDAEIGAFLAAVEHSFGTGPKRTHELNLVFEASAPKIDASRDPASREGHVEFFWGSVEDLARRNLQPEPLRALAAQWVKGTLPAPGWASTMEPEGWQT